MLPANRLGAIIDALDTSRRAMQHLVRQNFAWALAYNAGELDHRHAERVARARPPILMESPDGVALLARAQSGQFDDLERPAHDILADDDRPHSNRRST